LQLPTFTQRTPCAVCGSEQSIHTRQTRTDQRPWTKYTVKGRETTARRLRSGRLSSGLLSRFELRACLKNSGAGLRPAMNGRLAREDTGERPPQRQAGRLPHYIFQTRSEAHAVLLLVQNLLFRFRQFHDFLRGAAYKQGEWKRTSNIELR